MALLELAGVTKHYLRGSERVVALDEVDLTVGPGEFVGLVGPSGSGKSTLLHVAAGLDEPDTGTVRLAGDDLAALDKAHRARLRRQRVGFVFQFFHLIPTLSVAENVSLPLVLDGRRPDQRVTALLDRVGLGGRRDHRPAELSGGEMQRAAIARALVIQPDLVLADEPTGNLDSATGAAVIEVLEEQVTVEGVALLMVTHDEHAAGRAGRTLHLRDGTLIDISESTPTIA